MNCKPILFSSEMVRAILEGRKTQTRRVIKPQPVSLNGCGWEYDDQVFVSDDAMQSHLLHEVYGTKGSPYGSIYGDGEADRLWVRETWATAATFNHQRPGTIPQGQYIWYRSCDTSEWIVSAGHWRGKWRPSIFMPRWASRLTLEVTDIRIERVQDISEADAMAEGVSNLPDYENGIWQACHRFAQLWDNINAKRGYPWESNPWVWCVSFRLANAQPEAA